MHHFSFWHWLTVLALVLLAFWSGRGGMFGGGSPPSAAAETGRRLWRIRKSTTD